jgi:hypothetical protein
MPDGVDLSHSQVQGVLPGYCLSWFGWLAVVGGLARYGAPYGRASLARLTREYRGSVGFRTMACSVGFRTMEIGFSVLVSVLRFDGNRHWSFVFAGARRPGFVCDHPGFLSGLRPLPFIGWFGIAYLLIG